MIRPELNDAAIVQGAAGTTQVVAAVAGKAIVVESLYGTMAVAGTLKFQSAANDKSGAMKLADTGGLVLPGDGPRSRYFKTNVGEALNIVTTGGTFNGGLTYRLEDV